MGQVLYGCDKTTAVVRRAKKNSQDALRKNAKRYGLNQKSVAKWKKREAAFAVPSGAIESMWTVLSIEDEAIVSGRESAKVLQAFEHALESVAVAIEEPREAGLPFWVHLGRDVRHRTFGLDLAVDCVAGIAS